MTEQAQIIIKEGTIQFYDVDKLYFPEICFVCGENAEKLLSKSILGRFTNTKENRKDYYLKIPICKECEKNRNIQTNSEVAKVLFPTILGIIGALVINFFTVSFLMALAIGMTSFLLPFIFFVIRMKSKVTVKNHLQIETKCFSENTTEDILQLTFSNKIYTNYLGKLNLKKNKDLILVDILKENKREEISASPTTVSKSETIGEKKQCPSCRASNPLHNNFCINCGNNLKKTQGVSKPLNIQKITPKPPIKPLIPISVETKVPTLIPIPIETKAPASIIEKDISNIDKCPGCKEVIVGESIFCTNCGTNLKKMNIIPKEALKQKIQDEHDNKPSELEKI